MNKQVTETSGMVLDLQNTKKLCEMLLTTPHYRKMGPEGIYAIVQKAQSLGINPLEALNGGMYYVNGKVEMQANLMAKMIRQAGHSFTPGKECDNTICILHGKRKDNGDTWKVSFSIDEAKKAGIYRESGPWGKYPEDMLYSRALSRLARRLFPDVIGNCYVEGEIKDAPPLNEPALHNVIETQTGNLDKISEEEGDEIELYCEVDPEFREKMLAFLKKKYDIDSIYEMPISAFPMMRDKALANYNKLQAQEEA